MSSENAGRRRTLIRGAYALIFAVFAALIGALGFQGLMIRQAIAGETRQIADRSAKQASLEKLSRDIKLIKLQVNDYDRLVWPTRDLGNFLTELDLARDDAGLRDVTTQTLATETQSKSERLPIKITGTGTYAQFQQFLERLEHLRRLSAISHLSVKAADPTMDGKISVEMTLSIYNVKPG